MPTLELISDKIFTFNENLSKFIQEDEEIRLEFNEYAKTLQNGLNRDSLAHFIFDKTLNNGNKVLDVYIEKNKDLSSDDKKALQNFKYSINSIFEVKKVTKNGFEMYNLVNEKDYTANSLIKMINYRSVIPGNFFVCRLIPYENEYYLLVLNNVLRNSDKIQAYKIAVSMQVDNPELLYQDNNKKLKALEKLVKDLQSKFMEFFNKNEIITMNKKIDELLGAFNDFAEDGTSTENIENMIQLPEKYSYFKINETVDPFDISSEKTSKEKYDVGIVFDPELGLQVLPFYGTFKQIFETENYKSVKGYEDCILDYFQNGKVSPFIIKKVHEEYGEKFLKIVCEVLKLEEKTGIDELIHKYKQDFVSSKKFSSTTILYASEVFSNLMNSTEEIYQEKTSVPAKVGRNDSCPCGSGKKYKKCCM